MTALAPLLLPDHLQNLRDHLLAQGWDDASDIVQEVQRALDAQRSPVLATWTLPWPPSVNGYFGTITKGKLAGRKFLSERGKQYRSDVLKLLLGKKPVPHGMPISLHILCYPPDRRVRDLDNICKSLQDALVAAEMMRDDEDVWDLHLTRACLSSPPGRVVIHVRQHILASEQFRIDVGDAYTKAMQSAHDEKQALKDLRRPLLEAPE